MSAGVPLYANSTYFREEGNKHFKSVTGRSDDVEEDTRRLGLALNYFGQAISKAANAGEKCRACKNYCVTRLKLYALRVKQAGSEMDFKEEARRKEWIDEIVREGYEAVKKGEEAGMTSAWLDDIRQKARSAFDLLLKLYTRAEVVHRMRLLKLKEIIKLAESRDEEEILCEIHIIRFDECFKNGVRYLQEKNFVTARDSFEQAAQLAEETRIIIITLKNANPYTQWRFDEFEREVVKKQEDIDLHRLICEAYNSLEDGKRHFNVAMREHEDLNMEEVYCALDGFRHANNLSKDKAFAIELEAESSSFLAQLLCKVMHSYQIGDRFAMQCRSLVISSPNKNLQMTPWYREVLKILEDAQKRFVNRDTDWMKEREKILESLEDEIAQLRVERSHSDFIDYIVSKFPPRNGKEVPTGSEMETKKKFLKAFKAYHPDTNKKGNKEETKWHVLCEEITKKLNNRFVEVNCSSGIPPSSGDT
uniref:J domain-containing protein n=1 Tax=Palpitomonas bilix TaxID=652834 RepID=A0A7S3GCR3_9EUKA|mmetsp:Transcript_43708/g.113952  ORF Transcript_43708/g.113952 Transcript_43708/m.113952 type:complete len:477 (+) Transcript_43708:322-1752(+)